MSTSPTQIETAAYELTALACQHNTDVAGFLWPALIGFAEQGVLKVALELLPRQPNQNRQTIGYSPLHLTPTHRTLRAATARQGLTQMARKGQPSFKVAQEKDG